MLINGPFCLCTEDTEQKWANSQGILKQNNIERQTNCVLCMKKRLKWIEITLRNFHLLSPRRQLCQWINPSALYPLLSFSCIVIIVMTLKRNFSCSIQKRPIAVYGVFKTWNATKTLKINFYWLISCHHHFLKWICSSFSWCHFVPSTDILSIYLFGCFHIDKKQKPRGKENQNRIDRMLFIHDSLYMPTK